MSYIERLYNISQNDYNPTSATDGEAQGAEFAQILTEAAGGDGNGQNTSATAAEQTLSYPVPYASLPIYPENYPGTEYSAEYPSAAGAEHAAAYPSEYAAAYAGENTEGYAELYAYYLDTENDAEPSYAVEYPAYPEGLDAADITPQSVENAIRRAGNTRNAADAQMAMLMLMMIMMMSSGSDGGFGGGGGGEMSMLMPLFSSMLTQLDSNTNDMLRSVMHNSGHDSAFTNNFEQLFFAPVPEVSQTGAAIIPVDAWRPIVPAIVSDRNNRSPQLYREVIAQLNVETAERYRPGRNGFTWCNIFVWDATRAMGAEIPFFIDPATGTPMQPPNTAGAQQQTAWRMEKWLDAHGAAHGWREVTSEEAQRHANSGRPAMTTAGRLQHVQMVVPSNSGGYDPVRGVAIAQAGRIVSNYMYITGIYGPNAMRNYVRYWVHD